MKNVNVIYHLILKGAENFSFCVTILLLKDNVLRLRFLMAFLLFSYKVTSNLKQNLKSKQSNVIPRKFRGALRFSAPQVELNVIKASEDKLESRLVFLC